MILGRSSPREERSALASPSSSPSRTRPPLHPLSALDGAQGPIDGTCTRRSGPGPAPYSAAIIYRRRHHPHLALLDEKKITIPACRSDRADYILFPRLGGLGLAARWTDWREWLSRVLLVLLPLLLPPPPPLLLVCAGGGRGIAGPFDGRRLCQLVVAGTAWC